MLVHLTAFQISAKWVQQLRPEGIPNKHSHIHTCTHKHTYIKNLSIKNSNFFWNNVFFFELQKIDKINK